MHGNSIVPDAYPAQLLDDYLAVARRRHPTALYATVLRTRSVAARHLLAHAVSRRLTIADLLSAARAAAGQLPDGPVNVAALADLAGAVALQNVLPEDPTDGPALYDLAVRLGGAAAIPARHQGIHAQLVFKRGDRAETARLLRTYRNMPEFVRATLEVDLSNPFAAGSDGRPDAWRARLARLLPAPGVELSGDTDLVPFDRLTATRGREIDDDARVSVVVSAYHPDRGLLTSVHSLLAQSWTNLEVLVVDDGSPPEYDGILDECAGLDPRVRLIKLATNSGTYTARNTACDAATGEFITFHDSDDWAHPHRLEQQVAPLQAQPELMATVSQGLTVSDRLIVTKPGRALNLLCTPSLMFRKAAVMSRLGYFDPIRKAADTEYLRRIGAAFGDEAVLRMPEILTLMRQGDDSLSRAEFRAGWKHPARVAYQSAYRPWHEDIKRGTADSYLDKDAARRRFAVPARFARQRTPLPHYDVVLACDWRPYGGPQKSMLEEIAALTGDGRRVAILHLESFRHMTEQLKPLCGPIQELINSGVVDQVLPTDDATTTLLVLRYPPVLQFRAEESISVRPKRVVILANQAPSESDGTDLRYEPGACTAIARQLFGAGPIWYPQGPAVRSALEPSLDPGVLAEADMPGIIADWFAMVPRKRFRSALPVVGRHSRDDWTKWPVDGPTVLQLYPDSPEVDVRIMGGAKTAKSLLRRELPANWIVYRRGELDVRNFLHQLDFYVYYPHPAMIEAFGRAILEALAAGCVTLLPPHFAPVFGDAALYAEPDEVAGLIASYRADPAGFLAQSDLARRHVRERFSHRSYLDLIAPLLAPVPKILEDLTFKERAS